MRIFSARRAFTLLEVLTTIAIIGILFSLTSYVYSSAQTRSRDQQRLSNLDTIANALEQYHLDNHAYPAVNPNANSLFVAKYQLEQIAGCSYQAGQNFLAPAYLPTIPEDPQYKLAIGGSGANCTTNQTGQYLYVTTVTNQTDPAPGFYLMARVERLANVSAVAPTSAQIGFYGPTILGSGAGLTLCDQTTPPGATCTHNYYKANNPN